jgi:predicted TIM-barrel fold metal-dependent hydrolase
MGEFCSVDRRRLRGAMLIPSNHPEIAATELRRAHKEEGLSILYLNPTPPNDVPWCDASREPIFRAAEELNITVVFHESTPGASTYTMGINRYRGRWPLIYLATHVVEAMFAYADVILGGVLERHPTLRVGSAEAHIHWLPGWLAMMDQQFSVASNIHGKKGGEEALSLKPSEYFIRQCFCAAFPQDTMIPEAMGVAPDGIVVISDWPHPLAGEYSQKGLAAIEHNPRIDAADRRKLLIDNPRRFL